MADFSSSANSTIISGTSGDDSIYSTGDYVTVDAGAGNDTVSVMGEGTNVLVGVNYSSVAGGAGNDFI